MLIRYVTNNIQRNVKDSVGKHLVRRKIAVEVVQASVEVPKVSEVPKATEAPIATPILDAIEAAEVASPEESAEKPRRGRYARRDLQAEE